MAVFQGNTRLSQMQILRLPRSLRAVPSSKLTFETSP